MSLEFMIKLLVGFRNDPETNLIVGYCPNLGLYSQGRTQKETEEALKGAISLFVKHGGLDKILQKEGNKIEMIPMGEMSDPIQLENFSKVTNFDLSAKIGRDKLCQPCA
jgi:hypothetical protein